MTKEMQKTLADHFAAHHTNTEKLFADAEGNPRAPYIHQEFPKVKYHATEPPVTVASPEHESELGDKYFDRPVKAKK